MSSQLPQRILVYRIGQIGDTVIALPAIWAVRDWSPSAFLCLLTERQLQRSYVPAADVLPREGLFDHVITYSSDGSPNATALLSALAEMRRLSFDTLVYLAPRLRTQRQVWRDLIFFRLAGIRRFVGHRGFQSLPRRAADGSLPVLEHEANHLLGRLSSGGVPVPPPTETRFDLRLTDDDHGAARRWMAKHIGESYKRVPKVAIGPGSKWPSKMWPEERFAGLGQRLVRELGLFPIVFGGPEDRALGERLVDGWGTGATAAGELSIRQSAAALASCLFYVGNDTGTMHLAAASGIRCVAIFAAQDWPGRWHPFGNGHIVLRRPVPCEGCCLSVCSAMEMRCMRSIEVEHVVNACVQIARTGPGSGRCLYPLDGSAPM